MIEICDNRESAYKFASLDRGDVFECNGTYAMKIDEVTIGSISRYNAVDLQSGDLRFFDRYADVTECKEVRLEIDE